MRSRLSARKIRRVVGIAFAVIDRNRRMGAERPLHRDAFRRVVVPELCRDNDAGRVALLDPGDRRGDQVMLRIEHRWIGLSGVKITRAAEGIRPGPARTMAHARCQIEADEFVSRVGLSFHYTVIVLDGVARLDQRITPTAIENELAAMSCELAQIGV